MLSSLITTLNKGISDPDVYASEFKKILVHCKQIALRIQPEEATILQPKMVSKFLELFEECNYKEKALSLMDNDMAAAIRTNDIPTVSRLLFTPFKPQRSPMQERWAAIRQQFHPSIRSTKREEPHT